MSRCLSLLSKENRGFALVEIMVVLVILVVLGAVYFGLRGNSNKQKPAFEGQAQTTLGKAKQAGESVACRNNLNQLRQMIHMESMEGSLPAKLSEKWGVPLQCPVSGYDYVYGPNTGQVSCKTPGHEDY